MLKRFELIKRVTTISNALKEIEKSVRVLQTDCIELEQELDALKVVPDNIKIRISAVEGCEIFDADFDGEDVDVDISLEE